MNTASWRCGEGLEPSKPEAALTKCGMAERLDRLVRRAVATVPGECAGNGKEVLLPFQIKLAKGIGKKTHPLFKCCHAVDAGGRRLARLRALLLKRDVLKEPQHGYTEEVGELGQHPRRSLLYPSLVGVV